MPVKLNEELVSKDLKIVKSVFDQHKVPFLLAYGTALGAYRDGKFLPDDDDIDLAITEEIDLKTKKSIGWMLYDLGFKTQDVAWNVFGRMEPCELAYNGTEKTGIIVCKKNIDFTIFFFGEKELCEKHGEEYVCIPKLGAFKLIATPTRFYKEHDIVKFYGEKYWIPHPIEEYLEFTYEDWKNPLKRDHGLTYFEMHPEHTNMIKNVMDKNQVFHYVKRNKEVSN